ENDWADIVMQLGARLPAILQAGPADPTAVIAADAPSDRQSPVADIPSSLGAADIEALYRKAVLFQREGRIAESMNSLRAVIQARPRHNEALTLLSILSQQAGDLAQGLELAERSLAISDQQPLTHNAKGLALRALERHDEAIACFDRLIALHPG